jgi:branched-chain amino acid aminotransferase
MIVFLNGQFVPEEEALVSVFDRGFLYGDGLFETVRVFAGRPFRWEQHIQRFAQGAAFLKIECPISASALRAAVDELIARNQMPECLLRVTLTRGVGVRGYSPKGADRPTLVMSLHPAPADERAPRWRLKTSEFRLPANAPLAQFKTCNKLAQILARAQADEAGADEALLLNTDGWVVEASSSNLFWMEDGAVCTPPLASGILQGVTRAVVRELCQTLGVQSRESQITPQDLLKVEGAFLSLSSYGIVEAVSLDGKPLSSSPLTERLQSAYGGLIRDHLGKAKNLTSSSRGAAGVCEA